MRCDFCGYTFSADAAEIACSACPLAGNCHLVRCPRCGYEMPPEAKLVTWLKRIWSKQTGQETATDTLRD